MHMSHILVLTGLLFTVPSHATEENPQPNSALTPEQVVMILVNALKENDESTDDGIATVFRFASPGNKANTGPLDRFSQMIKRGFSDMLNHADSRVGEIKTEGATALQAVYFTTTSGNEVGYLFQIGEQRTGEHKGMWMTEAVYPLPSPGKSI